jgi:hypothetical protein
MNQRLKTPLFFVSGCALSVRGEKARRWLSLACAAIALGGLPAHAQTDIFTNLDGTTTPANSGVYTDSGNWSLEAIPNTSDGQTALIDDGVAVTYTPGGDLMISNGGMLEISSGSFTQNTGNNYIQLGEQGSGPGMGDGTILVNGGTFNQGTDSAQPFNITGTGNAFTVSSGTVNITGNLHLDPGLTFLQSGGTINATGGETDFNTASDSMTGGTLNTNLITGVNGTNTVFTLSGGTLNLGSATSTTGQTYIYSGGPTAYLNFTLNSTAVIKFLGTGANDNQIDGFINAGVIEVNGATVSPSAFTLTDEGSYVSLTLATNVPEPSSSVFVLVCLGGVAGWMFRRSGRILAVPGKR